MRIRTLVPVALGWLLLAPASPAQHVEKDVDVRVDDLQSMGAAAVPMNDFVYRIEGEGAFFLINTSEGSVLVDTGTALPQNDEQMRLVAAGPDRIVDDLTATAELTALLSD